MILRLLLLVFITINAISICAEGTYEVAPNDSIYIHDTLTTDIAALHIGSDEFNNFALLSNDNKYSQLYINIQDPTQECIYLGFSKGHFNRTLKNPPLVDFTFVIKDPNGNIVYGPQLISESNANVKNWQDAYNGPNIGSSQDGYNALIISSQALMSQGWNGEGDYYIQFDYERPRPGEAWDGFLIDYWDISVVNCQSFNPGEIKGRIWSYNWALFAINDFGFPERPFNGKFYVCAIDSSEKDAAFISSIDFSDAGFRPAAFNIAFNSFGTRNTGDVRYDRRSVRSENRTTPLYPIFLNDPKEIYESPETGSIEYVGLERDPSGNMCFKVLATRSGVVELLLDFHNGDGKFSESTEDVLLTTYISSSQVGSEVCIPWNGVDGNDNAIINEAFPIQINYNRGVFHFPIYDAEYLEKGYKLSRVRPGGSTPKLFYDDSELNESSGTNQEKVNLSGCDVPCHTWSKYIGPDIVGFGNLNTINSWWYSDRQYLSKIVSIDLNYYIPNAITADGNGINDRAKVFIDDKVVGVERYEVFDRWGNRVYEEKYDDSVQNMKGWNGKSNGYFMTPAVFMYKATIEVHPGVYVIEHGTLTLIR